MNNYEHIRLMGVTELALLIYSFQAAAYDTQRKLTESEIKQWLLQEEV